MRPAVFVRSEWCIRFRGRLAVHPRGSALGVPDSSSSWIALLCDKRRAPCLIPGCWARPPSAPSSSLLVYFVSRFLGRIRNWTGQVRDGVVLMVVRRYHKMNRSRSSYRSLQGIKISVFSIKSDDFEETQSDQGHHLAPHEPQQKDQPDYKRASQTQQGSIPHTPSQ